MKSGTILDVSLSALLYLMGSIVFTLFLYLIPAVKSVSFWIPAIHVMSSILLVLSGITVAIFLIVSRNNSHVLYEFLVAPAIGSILAVTCMNIQLEEIPQILQIFSIIMGLSAIIYLYSWMRR